MKCLLISSFISILLIFHSVNGDSIIWNVPSNGDYSFNDILSKSNQQPVIVFMHPNFDISQFSRQANAYGLKNDGGRMKNLKKWIDRSEGYTVTTATLTSQLLQYFDTTEYVSNNPPIDNNDISVLLVSVADWDDLDSKAEEVRRIFKGKKYVAILTTVVQNRKKRAVSTTETPVKKNITFVTVDDCKLYAEGIYFLIQVKNSTSNAGRPTTTTCKVTLDNNPIASGDLVSPCANFSGTMLLSFTNFEPIYCVNNGAWSLDSLTIALEFAQSNTTDSWFVNRVGISANGSLIQTPDNVLDEIIYEYGNRTWDVDYISGAQYFSYACSDPPIVFQSAETTVLNSKDAFTGTVRYGLAFKNLQVQPFAALHNTSNSMMTDNVDDCTPFFNIYIWMFLISALLLVSIILCGMGMMGSLRSMDRFDDTRAKTITVNVVN